MYSRNKSFLAVMILLYFIVQLKFVDYRKYNMQVMDNQDIKNIFSKMDNICDEAKRVNKSEPERGQPRPASPSQEPPRFIP